MRLRCLQAKQRLSGVHAALSDRRRRLKQTVGLTAGLEKQQSTGAGV